MEARVGIEPTNKGFADLCLTTWLPRRWKALVAKITRRGGPSQSGPAGPDYSRSVGTPLNRILDSADPSLFDVQSKARGPAGSLPITPEMLLQRPSGDIFGWTQDAGMGWDPAALGGKEILILSTHGGIRAADGTPVALGYHTGHWEVGLLMDAAAKELQVAGRHPVRRLLHRSLRRAHSGHHRHDGFPPVSQRCGERYSAA